MQWSLPDISPPTPLKPYHPWRWLFFILATISLSILFLLSLKTFNIPPTLFNELADYAKVMILLAVVIALFKCVFTMHSNNEIKREL